MVRKCLTPRNWKNKHGCYILQSITEILNFWGSFQKPTSKFWFGMTQTPYYLSCFEVVQCAAHVFHGCQQHETIAEPESGVTMLNNILDSNEQCGQHDIVIQSWSKQHSTNVHDFLRYKYTY